MAQRRLLLVLAALGLSLGACRAFSGGLAVTPPVDLAPMTSRPDGSRHAGQDLTFVTDIGHPLCVNGMSVDGPYPNVSYRMAMSETPPDLSFESPDGPISLHDYFEPCAPESRLLVVRVGAPWCGTCVWSLRHTNELKQLDVGKRLLFLDLIVSNRDNDPPKVADVAGYKALIDAPDKVALDPDFRFQPVNAARSPLPQVVLIDTRTMMIRNVLTNPGPQLFALRLQQELAELDGKPLPPYPTPEKFDNLFTRDQWELLHAMTLPGAPPPDPTNAKADDAAAAAFGKQLFSDTRLSPSGKVACGSCHDPTKQFQDGLPQATGGVAHIDRNTPSIVFAAHSRWLFWDGRADTQWMQALVPIENDKELAASRLFVAHAIANSYQDSYTSVFGAADWTTLRRLPAAGKPGDASWSGMRPEEQKLVNDLFSNVGKALAAYERTLRVKPNRLDSYIGGDLTALTADEKEGAREFFASGCAQCHFGPRLTDDAFHPDRFPTGRQDGTADLGRIAGVTQLIGSEFAQPHSGLLAQSAQLGSFKTAALRGVAATAPYGHGGTLATLQDVLSTYSIAGLPQNDARAVGTTELWLPTFPLLHSDRVVLFLQALTAEIAP